MSQQEQLTIQHEAGHGSIKLTAYLPSQRVGVEVTGENAVMDWAELFAFVDQFRKPRTITTVAELDALHMVVVRTAAGTIANVINGRAYCFGYEGSAPASSLALPATVLHEGQA